MAAPAEITMKNFSGKYGMSKLGDDQDAVLSLQNIGWITRKAIKYATITLTIKEYEKDGVVQIDITSVASGLSQTSEARHLDWVEGSHQDELFGNVTGKSRFISESSYEKGYSSLTDEDVKFLLGKVDKSGKPTAFLEPDNLVQTLASNSENGWDAEQVWGFENIDGVRRHTRRVVCKNKKGKTERIRLVYDYQGSA